MIGWQNRDKEAQPASTAKKQFFLKFKKGLQFILFISNNVIIAARGLDKLHLFFT